MQQCDICHQETPDEQLQEVAGDLHWDAVLAEAFERSIKDGKVTLEALKNKGNELPPEYCKRIAAYLQSKQAA